MVVGATWTTDAPFREDAEPLRTTEAKDSWRRDGGAALYTFRNQSAFRFSV